jgi:hypothetical protein
MLWSILVFLVKWIIPLPTIVGGTLMFLIRPKLVIRTDKPRCRENVALRGRQGVRVMVLRLYIENRGLRQTETTSFVDQVSLNDKVVESERSLLNRWADSNTEREGLGHKRGKYINLCHVVEECPSNLLVYTIKGGVGYNFHKPGLYRFIVSAQGKGLHSGYRVNVEIRHDGSLQGLDFLAVDGRTSEFKIGEFIFGRIGHTLDS